MYKRLINQHGLFISKLIIALLFIAYDINLIGAGLRNKITVINTLDFSWQVDFIEKLLHGFVAGRDFIFTYGPLYQLVAALPSLILHIPSYLSIQYSKVIFDLIFLLLIFFFVQKVTSGEIKRNIVFVFLLLSTIILGIDSNSAIRVVVPLIYALFLINFCFLKRNYFKFLLLILYPSFWGLYSYDIFTQCLLLIVTFGFVSLFSNFFNLSQGKKLLKLFLILFSALFTQVITSFLISGSLNYIRYSLDTVQNYFYILNSAFPIIKADFLLIFPASICLLIFFLVKNPKIENQRKNIIIFLSIAALLQLRSALIRSDHGHIIMGIYPSIIMFPLLCSNLFKKKKDFSIVLFIGFIVAVIFVNSAFSFPNFSFLNFSKFIDTSNSKEPFSSFYKTTNYYSKDNSYLKKLITENKNNVMTYPYDNYLLAINGVTYDNASLQYYQYSGSLVEKESVEQLSKNPPKFIILGIDKHTAIDLDEIPNFTRNPVFSSWVIKNYSVHSLRGQYLVLEYVSKKENGKILNKTKKCSIYRLTISRPLFSISDKFKPSLIYLLDKKSNSRIRLPYVPGNSEYLIFEDYSNIKSMEALFLSGMDFKSGYLNKEKLSQLEITKKSPFLRKKTIYPLDKIPAQVECYN